MVEVASIRSEHQPELGRSQQSWCGMCDQRWPCETDGLLDLLAAEQAHCAVLREALAAVLADAYSRSEKARLHRVAARAVLAAQPEVHRGA